jgi:O-methyltransferase
VPPLSTDELVARILDQKLSLLDESRLRNLAHQVRSTPHGALVECGVGRGGALALMAATRADGQAVWGFDSFDVMPPLTERDHGEGEVWVGFSVAGSKGAAVVKDTFEAVGVTGEAVHVIEGWFEDTFPTAAPQVGPIAVLRLDSDWYAATRLCLDTFYDLVVPGGAVLVDDYNTFRGCREAVDEFRAERGITGDLVVTHEESEVYWIVTDPG